jgi:hypothetical protein
MREMKRSFSYWLCIARCAYTQLTPQRHYISILAATSLFLCCCRPASFSQLSISLSVCFNNIRVWAWLLISYIKRRRHSSRFCAPLSRRASASLMKFCSRSWALGKRRRTFHSIPCAAAFCSGSCSAHSIHSLSLSVTSYYEAAKVSARHI